MLDARKLICSTYCKPYNSNAELYIEPAQNNLPRHLVAIYEKGGYGGRPEFKAAIPDEWTEQEVEDFILWPMKSPTAPYPAWEVPARAYGSPTSAGFCSGSGAVLPIKEL